MFIIYKCLLSLGDSKLLETILSNDFYVCTFGALECKVFNLILLDDPEVLQNQDKDSLEEEEKKKLSAGVEENGVL